MSKQKPMTVGELIEGLQQLVEDDKRTADYRTLLAQDPEGNGYWEVTTSEDRPPFSLETTVGKADWSGRVEVGGDGERNVLVIWPG